MKKLFVLFSLMFFSVNSTFAINNISEKTKNILDWFFTKITKSIDTKYEWNKQKTIYSWIITKLNNFKIKPEKKYILNYLITLFEKKLYNIQNISDIKTYRLHWIWIIPFWSFETSWYILNREEIWKTGNIYIDYDVSYEKIWWNINITDDNWELNIIIKNKPCTIDMNWFEYKYTVYVNIAWRKYVEWCAEDK